MHIPLIYQDEDLVAVNKPAGLPTHPDEEGSSGFDVVTLLQAQLSLDYLGVHHRLDREVSGVLAFAARPAANPALAQAFEGRQAVKEYLAIVWGRAPRPGGLIDAPLVGAGAGLWRIARRGEPGGKSALTRYRVEAEGPNGLYSLLHLQLETGRTHQLRLHLAHLGCPIIGDGLYGRITPFPAQVRPDQSASVPGVDPFPRLLLHALRLTLPHPTSGQPVSFEAPLPALFQKAAARLALPELELATRLSKVSLAALKASDRAGLAGLLALAQARRVPLANDPAEATTAYRLVNGAGDGLPGITLDRYGSALVLNCYDPLLEPSHPALRFLLEAVVHQWPGSSVYGKFRPRQLSNLSQGGNAGLAEVAPTEPLTGPARPEVTIRENGLAYLIRPGEGLSPGLFLDMREVRTRLADWTSGKTVLNCFSYTGAFGLVAALNGAARAVNLDAGGRVLAWGKENYRANGLTPDDYDFVEGDVFDWLGRWGRRGQTFELVILDPPSYSTVKKTRWAADKNYSQLVALAARTVAPGGLLLACSNQAALSRRAFRQAVLKGLDEAGRPGSVLHSYHEPDLDFPRPASLEAYLKVLVLRLD